MRKGTISISLLFLSTLLMNGCTSNNNPQKPVELKMGGSYSETSSDEKLIVGNKDDENSIFEPVKKIATTKLGKEITDFQIGELIKYEENIFLNFSFKVNKTQYYGQCQAYVKGKGWVIVDSDFPPLVSQLPVMYGTTGSILYNENQKNSVINATNKRVTIFSGYVNDSRVRTIKLTFEQGQGYSIKIKPGQKTYMYLYTGTDIKKSETAYDEDGRMIHKQ